MAASVPITGWGHNYYGQASPPGAATNLVAVSAGWQHSLALRADGTLVPWGWTNFGLAQIPPAATNIVAMVAGVHHDLALRADGTVLAWGDNTSGQTNVPPSVTNVVALAGGEQHSVALRADGTVVAWGDNTLDQLNLPPSATNIVAIAAGLDYTLALKADGSLVGWGWLVEEDIVVPDEATNVTAVAAGALDCLVLRSDGTLVAWGRNFFGENDIPTNAVNVTGIGAGELFSLAALQDGTVIGWGDNYYGQSTPPASVTHPLAIYAGDDFGLAWLPDSADGVGPRIWKQPEDRTIPGGDTLFLHPGINGTPPLRCQWYFNDSPIAGQTNLWLALPNANPTQTGGYSIVITNDFGAVTSAVATITVPAIQITTQPTNLTAMMNTNVTLSATVAGTAPLSFRWQKDGQDLSDTNRVSGSATTSLSIANLVPTDTGNYQLIITNAYATVTSDVAVLTVQFPQPLLNVDFGPNSPSLKTGLAAMGQTASDFWNGYAAGTPGLTNLLFADGSPTRVSVVVSNGPSWFWNNSTDPMLHEAIIPVGSYNPFSVGIFGLSPGNYDFFLYTPGYTYITIGADFELVVGGVSLGHKVVLWGPDVPPWQEGAQYGTFHNVSITAPGQTVAIRVAGNYGMSPNIAGLQIGQFLTSASAPVLWSQPSSQNIPLGSNFVLNATGSGYPAPLHLWFSNGTLLTNGGRFSGADGNTVTISGAQFADTGDYYAILTNAAGVVTSEVAQVVVGMPPTLTVQPTNEIWIVGMTRSLVAEATGTAPLGYQWYLGSTALVDDAHRSGTASRILSISNVLTSDAGTYTLVVTNLFGSVSSTSTMVVIAPPAITAQPAGHSIPVGLPVTLSASVSGTAPLGYQWRLNGTDVPGATSNVLSFAALTEADFGGYRLVVSNYGGTVTSDVAQLTVGPVATWGTYGQRLGNVLWPGPGLSNVTALAAGYGYSLALRGDGTLSSWGNTTISNTAAGLSGIVGIAAGPYHALAIRADGTVVAWGSNTYGQTNVPATLSNVVAVTGGSYTSAALRADGKVEVWGGLSGPWTTNISPGLIHVAAIDACGSQTLALRQNGTVVGWGGAPLIPVPPYLHGAIAVSAGGITSDLNLALLTNGTVAAWSGYGPATNVPPGLTNLLAVEVAGGANDQGISRITGVGLALRSEGTVAAWGSGIGNITNVPPGLSNVVAIAGGPTHALALVNDGRPLIVRPPIGGTFCSGSRLVLKPKVLGSSPCTFQWFKDGNALPSGTSSRLVLASVKPADAGSYQLVVSNALGVAQSVPVPLTIVDSAPVLVSQPLSGFAYYGSPFSVGAAVIGSGPMQLNWLQDGHPVASGMDELAFDRALPQHGGAYQLIASNPFGSVTSMVAQITFSRVASWGTGPGLTNAPVDLGSVLGVASGQSHALAIQSNRTVVAWGVTSDGTTNVPPDLSNVVAVAGGGGFSVALKSDGTVAAWGLGSNGQTNVPGGLTNVIAISVGMSHTLALCADGTVASWGYNTYGQVPVPAGLSNVVAVAAGAFHSLALKDDGAVVGWGLYGTIPTYTNVVAIAAGYHQSVLLQADGTMVTWSTAKDATTLPADSSNVMAVSAGGGYQGHSHSVALRGDGRLMAWGDNSAGQLMIPSDLVSATAISAGGGGTLAFLGDGSPAITIQPWSRSVTGGTNVTLGALVVGRPPVSYQWYCNGQARPGATSNCLALTGIGPNQNGEYQLVAMNQYGSVTSAVATVTVTLPPVRLVPLGLSANGFKFTFPSLTGVVYVVEVRDDLAFGTWTELEQREGTGGTEIVTDTPAPAVARFYRVRALYGP